MKYLLLIAILFFTVSVQAADIVDAEAATIRGDYERAIQLYPPLALLGNIEAQARLGQILIGVLRSLIPEELETVQRAGSG